MTVSKSSFIRLCLCPIVLAACRTPEQPDVGIPHVDSILPVSYSEGARIGNVDDPVLGFSRIWKVVVSESDEVHVLELRAQEVKVFDTRGTLLRRVGRQGQGPGEFGVIQEFGLIGDTLWIHDAASRKISWFNRTGALLFETPGRTIEVATDHPSIVLQAYPLRPRSDGLIEAGLSFSVQDVAYSAPVLAFNRDGEVGDTVGVRRFANPGIRIAGFSAALPPPQLMPVSPVNLAAGEDSIWVRWNASDAGREGTTFVRRVTAAGDTILRQDLRYTPIPVPASVFDSLVDSRRGSFSPSTLETLVRAMEVPPFRPPIRRVHVGADGAVWLALHGEALDVTRWVGVGPTGEVIGRVDLPTAVTPAFSRGTELWAVELDDLAVPWLVRLDLDLAAR